MSDQLYPPSIEAAHNDLDTANDHCQRIAYYLEHDLTPDTRDVARAVLAIRAVVSAILQAELVRHTYESRSWPLG